MMFPDVRIPWNSATHSQVRSIKILDLIDFNSVHHVTFGQDGELSMCGGVPVGMWLL
jgi:hypothetical protein